MGGLGLHHIGRYALSVVLTINQHLRGCAAVSIGRSGSGFNTDFHGFRRICTILCLSVPCFVIICVYYCRGFGNCNQYYASYSIRQSSGYFVDGPFAEHKNPCCNGGVLAYIQNFPYNVCASVSILVVMEECWAV